MFQLDGEYLTIDPAVPRLLVFFEEDSERNMIAKLKRVFTSCFSRKQPAENHFPINYLGKIFPFEDDPVSVYRKGRTGDVRRYHWGHSPTCVFKCVEDGWQLIAIEHRVFQSE